MKIEDLRLVTLCSHRRFTAHPQGFGPYCYDGEVGGVPTRKQLINIIGIGYGAALKERIRQATAGEVLSVSKIVDAALGEDT